MKRLLIFGAALLLSVSAAGAESDRIALLIGNGDYEHAPDAETAVIDVRSVGRALEAAGWEVTIGTDLDREEMQDALQDLADQGGDARDLLIYYAGHALRSAERTYLAPVDQKADSAVDVEFGAVPLSLVLRILEGADDQGVLLLDAAQVEGFRPQSFAEPGLGKIDPPKGVAIISAAPPGQAIRRTGGQESRFARLLVDEFMRSDAKLMATADELGAPLWVAGSASDDFALAASV
ncbi:MAG TPA: caspase family protein, partial [Paracoccaceae bacterium]|nr:caspase family protein [Paracoccaceae bacterium]